jgi:hypothetical protein
MDYTEPEPREIRGFALEGDDAPIEVGGEDA